MRTGWGETSNLNGRSPDVIVKNTKTTETTWCYAKGSMCQAELESHWCLQPIFDTGNDLIRNVTNEDAGWKFFTCVNTTGTALNANFFNAIRHLVWPYFKAIQHSNWQANGEFSELHSSLVVYTDQNGKEHTIDEGMFLTTLDAAGDVTLQLKFKPIVGTSAKNFKLYFSKKPFNYEIEETDYLDYKYESMHGTDLVMSTNDLITVRIGNFAKNDDIYMYWEPIGLDATDDVVLEEIMQFNLDMVNA